MKKEEITEGNQLIAEFMGLIYKKNPRHVLPSEQWDDVKGDYSYSMLHYDVSWDWLMPVVFKISKSYDFSLSSVGMWACYISRQDSDVDDHIATMGGYDPVILNVWASVVQFIKWYNKNPKLKA